MWSNAAEKHFNKLQMVQNRATHYFIVSVKMCETRLTVEAESLSSVIHQTSATLYALSSYRGTREEQIRSGIITEGLWD